MHLQVLLYLHFGNFCVGFKLFEYITLASILFSLTIKIYKFDHREAYNLIE